MDSDELKKLRASTGLSQQKFGVLVLGVTGETVSRWERGDHTIDGLRARGIRAVVKEYLAKQKRK